MNNKSFLSPIKLTGLFGKHFKKSAEQHELGAPPGIEHLKSSNVPPASGEICISSIDFSETHHQKNSYDTIEQFIEAEKPEWSTTRWIDIQGIHPYVLRKLQENFGIHPLAVEDALHVPQRSKVEEYDDFLFVILRMLRFEGQNLINEQVCFFFFKDTIITVQESRGDVWEKVRTRTEKKVSRFRKFGAPYLLYALVDAIIDHIFPFLDLYFESIDELEEKILTNPSQQLQTHIHTIKRELAYLRQATWPMQNVIATIAKDEYELLPTEVENYFRDVHDHASQAAETLEMYRETANALQDLYMAAASNRMNEVMKALTIMASLFLPLTFLAGIYGMNFEVLPELRWKYSYAVFWLICLVSMGSLLFYFKRKGWIGK